MEPAVHFMNKKLINMNSLYFHLSQYKQTQICLFLSACDVLTIDSA